MKKSLLVVLSLWSCLQLFCQDNKDSTKESLVRSLADEACKCVDSINVYDKTKEEINREINQCIDKDVTAYQLGVKLLGVNDLKKDAVEKNGKKEVNISISMDKNSAEYKEYYYELERYMMANCKPLKNKVTANDKLGTKSLSEDPEAMDLYSKGLGESKKENFKKAISYFEKALKKDSQFAFAWDNMGLCYRQLNDYDKALNAYKKSLEIDSAGTMPLQNIAIVYQYKKEYQLAIDAYKKLSVLDKNNPEVFYGIGQVYTVYLADYENGLDNICKAYRLYTEQNSPYRTDAEKILKIIYDAMKKQGKEERFNEILKNNNMNTK